MDFGISFPQTDIGNDPAVIRDFVQTAEDLGFQRLTLVDHILGAKEARDALGPSITPSNTVSTSP